MQNIMRFADLWRGIGYAGIDSVQDISTQYGAKIQQRAYFNFDFYVYFGRSYPVDYFKLSSWRQVLRTQNNYQEQWDYPKEAADE
jgi:hypothetical protein